jgi:hypothetical protein
MSAAETGREEWVVHFHDEINRARSVRAGHRRHPCEINSASPDPGLLLQIQKEMKPIGFGGQGDRQAFRWRKLNRDQRLLNERSVGRSGKGYHWPGRP